MKIKLKLTIWYYSVTLAILLIFSLGTYLGMKSLLMKSIDDELEITTDTIERSYNPATSEFLELQHSAQRTNLFLEYYLEVFDSAGNEIYSSPIAARLKLNHALYKNASSRSGYTVKIRIDSSVPFVKTNNKGIAAIRFYQAPLYYENEQVGHIVIGIPIEHIENSLAELLYVLLFAIFIGVLLIGTGSYILTRKALKPINVITRRANHISKSNLNERIDIINDDELGQLSKVLNNLLGRLQKAFDSQQQFLGDAAHELKTPLSILRSHWESELNNENVSLEIKEKIVHDIETITRLNKLINNLILLSRTEAIEAGFELGNINLSEIVEEVLPDVQVLAEMKSQAIEVVGMEQAVIRGDRTRLFQLFFNIIDNAIKYTGEGGKVWISVRNSESHAVVEIRDNGLGIPPDDLPHIFERFYRVQKDRNRKTGGSGLGLSICKLITELHGGTIEVESKWGEGSSFKMSFPLAAEE